MSFNKDILLHSEATEFLTNLVRNFKPKLQLLLAERQERQRLYDKGYIPNFLSKTKHIRKANWYVAPIPKPLMDRTVEITGPTERKMIINALNSGADVFMADFEDSLSPTWDNILDGQINLYDAVRKTITYKHPTKGLYELNNKTAVLFVRPRGLHLDESHFLVDDEPIPASLFDFGLYMFHNAEALISQGLGPYFYLPKLESYLEARWWNEIFNWTQDYLGIERGSVRATVLIETLPAAFQMNEILWELKDHSAGLNCGRWDYIFSFIKTFRNHSDKVLPDRSEVTMETHFMRSYAELAIHTCHRRGIHAMGGMAAQIPIKNDAEANETALNKVRQDKIREVKMGHDGTWVAHPALVSLAREQFDKFMFTANQINSFKKLKEPTQKDLIEIPPLNITMLGLTQNISVGIQYIEAWLCGNGCVPLYNLMEDAATAEISRTQVWQWLNNDCNLNDGTRINKDLVEVCIANVAAQIKEEIGETRFSNGKFEEATELFRTISTGPVLVDFLTLPAYEKIC